VVERESINANVLGFSVKVCVNLSRYWPGDLSVNAAYEELLMQGLKVDRRTLAAAKTGSLTKSEFVTLVRLRDWVRRLTGNQKITVEDLFVVED